MCKPCQSKQLIRLCDCTIISTLKAYTWLSCNSIWFRKSSLTLDSCIAPLIFLPVQKKSIQHKIKKGISSTSCAIYINAHALFVMTCFYGAHVKLSRTLAVYLLSSAFMWHSLGINLIAPFLPKSHPSQSEFDPPSCLWSWFSASPCQMSHWLLGI